MYYIRAAAVLVVQLCSAEQVHFTSFTHSVSQLTSLPMDWTAEQKALESLSTFELLDDDDEEEEEDDLDDEEEEDDEEEDEEDEEVEDEDEGGEAGAAAAATAAAAAARGRSGRLRFTDLDMQLRASAGGRAGSAGGGGGDRGAFDSQALSQAFDLENEVREPTGVQGLWRQCLFASLQVLCLFCYKPPSLPFHRIRTSTR